MKPQIRNLTLLLFFIGVIVYLYIEYMPVDVDKLFINGRIYTMDAKNTITEAIAVRGERIEMLGSTEELKRRCKPKEIIDLKGKTVFPGFIDSHAHFLSLGLAMMTVDLIGVLSENDAAKRAYAMVDEMENGRWIRGRGWNQNLWKPSRFPTSSSLDRLIKNNPVYLVRIDGHAAWVNSLTMKLAGITKETKDPEGGKIIRDSRGNPTGIFIDEAMNLISSIIPRMSDSEMEKAIKLAADECTKVGITTVHDMGIDNRQIEIYKKLIAKNELPVRIYASVEGTGDSYQELKKSGPIIGFGGNHITLRSLKLYMDGALGSRGAALIEPYDDDPTNRGLTMMSESTLTSIVIDALKNGIQVCVHSIGDRANHIVLDAYEKALKDVAIGEHRLRIEHVQILDKADVPRFKKLGVIPAMQPVHCTSDMYWVAGRIGEKRSEGAYAWRSLLETGVHIAGGSDFPVEYPNPLFSIYAAVTRQDQQGVPRNVDDVKNYFQLSRSGIIDSTNYNGGWFPSQKMTREEAIRSFTIWAAEAGFEEKDKGSLEKGKLADFVVLSKDIMTIPVMEIWGTEVEMTVVGGELKNH